MADKGIRNLAHLQSSASTARVLNLLSTWRHHHNEPEYSDRPFFKSKRLNRALIIKHRLRGNELELFTYPRMNATKVVLPMDPADLNSGGRYAFVGQRHFLAMISDVIGQDERSVSSDIQLLKMLDRLPSFDPFLLREELKRNDYAPASCYLELTDADLKRIFAFVESEIEPLVRMSVGGAAGSTVHSRKLVEKILSSKLDNEMEPLRQVLRLGATEFAEGIFCWKGFLYYKWVHLGLSDITHSAVERLISARPMGKQDAQSRLDFEDHRAFIKSQIDKITTAIKASLDIYDHAYAELTAKANPTAFRDFLLSSPARFSELGESLGALQHITSFCDFRFPKGQRVSIRVDELMDIFEEFRGALQI